MVVEKGVGSLGDVPRLRVASRGSALGMVEAKGVKLKNVPVVLRDKLVFVFPMGVGDAVNFQDVQRVLKEVLTSAKPTEVGSGAYFQVVPREQKGVPHCAKRMVVENAVSLMEVGFAPKVYMVARTSALRTVVGKDVLCQGVRRVRVVALTVVSSMVVENAANLWGVGRAHKVAPTFARLMVEGNAARGETGNVRSLLGERAAYVLHITACRRRRG